MLSYYLLVFGSNLHVQPCGKTWSWTGTAYGGGTDVCEDEGVEGTPPPRGWMVAIAACTFVYVPRSNRGHY